MFQRCYSKKHQRIDYSGCTIDPEFHRFSDFATWALNQIGCLSDGFQLDKDILIPGNRVYGPNTCAFVPAEINSAITGCLKKKQNVENFPLGVRFLARKKIRQFCAEVSNNGKGIHLGYFDSPDEAFMAYKLEKEKIIKELAMKYKSYIDPRVYTALMKYEIRALAAKPTQGDTE